MRVALVQSCTSYARSATMIKRSFMLWLSDVDAELVRRSGLGVDDLPDWLYRDAYDDGAYPVDVARDVLADNDFPL